MHYGGNTSLIGAEKIKEDRKLTSLDDEFGTPWKFYRRLNREFRFTIDVCASDDNTKCNRYYTKELDGLKQSWSRERVFCNPPYSKGNTLPWILKAHEEVTNGYCVLALLLVPASRCEQPWFHDIIRPYHDYRFIKGRIKFDGGDTTGMKPSMILIFRNENFLVW